MLDAPLEENEVILSRRLKRAGRSHAYVNDQPAAVSTLKQVGDRLVDVHGQRESESLLQPAYQLHCSMPSAAWKNAASVPRNGGKVRDLRRRFADLSAAREQRQRELALIRFEREELDQAALEPGEVAEKTRERERLAHAQNLQTFAEQASGQLYDEDGSVVERLGRLQREAQSWAALDPGLEEVVRRLEETAVGGSGRWRGRCASWAALGGRPGTAGSGRAAAAVAQAAGDEVPPHVDELIVYRVGLDEQETRLQKEEDDLGGLRGASWRRSYAQLKASGGGAEQAAAKGGQDAWPWRRRSSWPTWAWPSAAGGACWSRSRWATTRRRRRCRPGGPISWS